MQYQIYQQFKNELSSDLEWHWKLSKIINDETVSISAKGFESIEECEKSIHLNMMADYKTAIVTNLTKEKLSKLQFK